jgi:hypothetical protein
MIGTHLGGQLGRARQIKRFDDIILMPTVLGTGPYRFYFYSHETQEPPHIHVDRDRLSAKFWLQPIAVARNVRFLPKELRRIRRLVAKHQQEFLEAWHGHFGVGR